MKALRFFAREDVRLVDIAEPVCGPEEVKINTDGEVPGYLPAAIELLPKAISVVTGR